MKAGSLDSVKSLSPLDVLVMPSRDARATDSFAQHLAAPERSTAPATSQTDNSTPPASSDAQRSSNDDDEQPATKAEEAEADEVAVANDTSDELVLTAIAAPAEALPEANPPAPEAAGEAEVAAMAEAEGKAAAKQPTAPTRNAAETPPAFEMAATDEANTAANTNGSDGEKSALSTPTTGDAAAATTEGDVASDAAVANAALTVAGEGKTTEGKATRTSKNAARAGEADDVPHGQASDEEAAADLKNTVSDEALPGAGKVREGRRERGRHDARNAKARVDAAEPTAATASSSPAAAPTTAATTPGTAPLPEVAPPVTDGTATAPPVTAPPPTVAAESPAAQQRLPQHLLARSTQRGSSGAPVTPAEQTRFLQRVAKAFQTAQARGGELQLRLSPAALGSLKLELKVQNGVMEARIEAENATAKAMLVENLPVLKERLAEQGIVVQKFDVELMDQQPQGQPNMHQDQSMPRGQRGPHVAQARETETNTAVTPTPEARTAATDGRLNVTV